MGKLIDSSLAHEVLGAPAFGEDGPDPLESPESYHAWAWPIRGRMALRYVELKLLAIALLRARGARSSPLALRQAIAAELGTASKAGSAAEWAMRGRKWLWGLICVVAVSSFGLSWARERQGYRRALGWDLQTFCDLNHVMSRLEVHRQWRAEAPSSREEGISDMELQLLRLRSSKLRESARDAVLGAFHRNAQLGEYLSIALDSVSREVPPAEMAGYFNAVNHAFDEAGIKIFLQPHSLTAPCSTLLAVPFWDPRRRRSSDDRNVCQTTMVASYDVENIREFRHEGRTYPVIFLRRLDRTNLAETLLGVTYRDGWGSQIYRDRIEQYSRDIVFAAVSRKGREAMFPLSVDLTPTMQEHVGRALRAALQVFPEADLDGLERATQMLEGRSDFASQARIRQSLLRFDHSVADVDVDELSATDKESVFSFLTSIGLSRDQEFDRAMGASRALVERLSRALEDEIAHHEVIHQIQSARRHDGRDTSVAWDYVLWDSPNPEAVVDETEAYLGAMVTSADVQLVSLTQLYGFMANTEMRRTPEYLAAHVAVAALLDAADSRIVRPRTLQVDDREFAVAYAQLSSLSNERLAGLARQAFLAIFGRPPPSGDVEVEPRGI